MRGERFTRRALYVASACLLLSLANLYLIAQSNQGSDGRQNVPSSTTAAAEGYFRDCTPAADEAHDCAVLERLFSSRLNELNEAPLSIAPDSRAQFIYRILFSTPVAPLISARYAWITVKNDSTLKITAKTIGMNNKILTSRSFSLSAAEANELLPLLRWEEFVKLDSLAHIPVDPSRLIRDGNHCVLEGIHQGQFHAIYRSQIQRDLSLDPAKPLMFDLYNFLNDLGAWQTQQKMNN
jgi:hypothetical protein